MSAKGQLPAKSGFDQYKSKENTWHNFQPHFQFLRIEQKVISFKPRTRKISLRLSNCTIWILSWYISPIINSKDRIIEMSLRQSSSADWNLLKIIYFNILLQRKIHSWHHSEVELFPSFFQAFSIIAFYISVKLKTKFRKKSSLSLSESVAYLHWF